MLAAVDVLEPAGLVELDELPESEDDFDDESLELEDFSELEELDEEAASDLPVLELEALTELFADSRLSLR